MQTLNEIALFFREHIINFWPLFVVACILTLIGQFMKRYVFTKDKAARSKYWLWARRTLPLHPIAAGFLVGIFWSEPQAGVKTGAESMFYFAGSGVLSVFLFSFFKQIMVKKYDLKVELFAASIPPPTRKSIEDAPLPGYSKGVPNISEEVISLLIEKGALIDKSKAEKE